MKTDILTIHPDFPEKEKIAHCAKIIRQGGLVIFPTETVYGIAADAGNPKAMDRLRRIKKRHPDKPFSLLVSQKEGLLRFSPCRSPKVFKLIDRYWPGPLTVILPGQEDGQTVGVRMPNHPVALCLVSACECNLAAPSANLEGRPAPRTCEEALKDMDGLVDVALDAGPATIGTASSIVDFTREEPCIIREGTLTQDQVDETVRKRIVLIVCTGNSCRSVMAEYLLRDKLKGRQDIEVVSAGISVFITAPASDGALRILKQRGIDARRHRSQPVTRILVAKADMILTMTQRHYQAILQFAPEAGPRMYLLKKFLDKAVDLSENPDIADPMGQPDQQYEACAQVIDRALDKVVEML